MVVGAWLFLSNNSHVAVNSSVTNNVNTTTNTTPQNNNQTSKTVNITITANGFNSSSVTIQKGDTVKFTNSDTSPHWPASNPHPSHTGYPGFDSLHPVAPGQSYSFKFERIGTFGFHDHLDPSLGGTVTVQ